MLACRTHADSSANTAVGPHLAPGAQAIVAGVLTVEVAGVLVLAAVRARLGVHGGRGDQHLLLVAHRVHLRTARPAAYTQYGCVASGLWRLLFRMLV